MVFLRALLNAHAQLSAEVSATVQISTGSAAAVEPPSRALARSLLLKFNAFIASDPHHDDDGEHRLIKEEDKPHWIVFFTVFFILIIFDNVVLNRGHEKISFGKACLYTLFFIFCALCFNVYIYHVRGKYDAIQWGTGYLLEWMLSVDNLFVFHRVFQIFKTPDEQKHKPLFWGIVGAIVFRMAFFCIEELLMHKFSWMHIVFGLFLIYTGIKAGCMDDDDERPDQGVVFIWLTERIPYINEYTEDGSFFVKVPVDQATGEVVDEADAAGGPQNVRREWRATKLMIVVICLEITDLIFAVDSVSAIVAQIPDLFLAYTACVFAMLGLRALFFIIDELVRLFSLLGYGVALILVVLGVKMILRDYVHVPPVYFLCFLISVIVTSMIASVIKEKYWPSEDSDDDDEDEKGSQKSITNSAKNSAKSSPNASQKLPDKVEVEKASA